MTVADFMSAALTEPGSGYYMTGDPIGVEGDFTTAPEISQIFGELIGLWCAQCWQDLGSPERINLVELGPGRGTLMADALRAAAVLPAFESAIRIHLVEASPSLKRRQRETLAGREVIWHRDLSSLPREPMILVANEFFDALPVRQFEKSREGWLERLVTLSPVATETAPAFAFTTSPATQDAIRLIPSEFQAASVGQLLEISPAVEAVARDLAERLAADGGMALAIDYGRSELQAGWSLQALYRHKRQEPLVAPGRADLTAHVDFVALASAAEGAGAEVWGPVTQETFLTALGVRERAKSLCAAASPNQIRDIESGVQRLIDPAQMGRALQSHRLRPAGLANARRTADLFH